jgi:hypothetical protein
MLIVVGGSATAAAGLGCGSRARPRAAGGGGKSVASRAAPVRRFRAVIRAVLDTPPSTSPSKPSTSPSKRSTFPAPAWELPRAPLAPGAPPPDGRPKPRHRHTFRTLVS